MALRLVRVCCWPGADFSSLDRVIFFRRCMKSNCESCELENDTLRLHSYCVLDYLNMSSLCHYSFIKNDDHYSAHI
jgi:hypothetical protein